MTTREPLGKTLSNLIDYYLDTRFEDLAGPALRVVTRSLEQRDVQRALKALQDEATRLAELGEKLLPTNPVLLEAMRVVEKAVRRAIPTVLEAGEPLAEGSVEAAEQIQPARAAGVLVIPARDLMLSEVRFAEMREYESRLDDLPLYTTEVMQNQAVQGSATGWSNNRIVKAVQRVATVLPVALVLRSMRTAYLTGYREASRIIRVENASVLSHQIRVATLDDRTCLACIALHGQVLPIGARVDDHYNGRCDSIPVFKNETRVVESGEDWLTRQPAVRQQTIMGPANYKAWHSGAVQLQDFIHTYESELYGQMPVQGSLLSILGSDAEQFYTKG